MGDDNSVIEVEPEAEFPGLEEAEDVIGDGGDGKHARLF